MVATKRCATKQELSGLLSAKNSTSDTEYWADHLESCPTCHSQLIQLAAAPQWWEESREHLIAGLFAEESATSPTSNASTRHSQSQVDLIEERGILAHYTIEKVLGYGGMATVYRGFDAELNRAVAIKVLHHHLARSGTSRQRFLREAQAAAAIAHPNVIPIYGVHQWEGKSFLVMPLVTGGSLQQRIEREGPLAIEDVLRIGLQIAEGLSAAHARGVVHRDVKPANILLEDGNKRVVLSDFGLARTLDDASLTASGLISGTPAFMSPEQARGEAVDHRSDLYSLGCVLFSMCTGHFPYQATSTLRILREVNDCPFPSVHKYQEQLPLWVDSLLERFVAKNPQDRFESSEDAAEWLRQHLLHVSNPKHPLPSAPPTRSRSVGVSARRIAGISLSAVFVLTVLFLFSRTIQSDNYISTRNSTPINFDPDDSAKSSMLRPLPTEIDRLQTLRDPIQLDIESMNSDLDQLFARDPLLSGPSPNGD